MSMGIREGNNEYLAHSINIEQLYGTIDSMAKNFRLVGIIISFVSVPGILLSGYGVYKGVN